MAYTVVTQERLSPAREATHGEAVGSLTEASGGAAAIVLSILGLLHISAPLMAAIATIVTAKPDGVRTMAGRLDEELCQRIVAESQDAIIFADRDGFVRLWNSGAAALFGYQAEAAIGQTLDLIIPEQLRPRHWDGWRKVMATGVTRYGRQVLAVPATRQDGARISIEFTIVVLRDESGKPLGAAATIRDVTARWLQEKEQRQRLADLEKQLKQRGETA